MISNQPGQLSIGEASRTLGVSEATLRQWTDEGRIEAFITPGGHRRYSEAELKRFMGTGGRVHGIRDVVASIELAPAREREIAARDFAGIDWYNRLDQESRAELGRLGRRVHELVIKYVSKPGKRAEILGESREVGGEFGRFVARLGVPLTDAMEAFMLHRAPLVEAAAGLMKKRKALNERAAEAIPLVTQLTDEILLSLVDAYQLSSKGRSVTGRKRPK